MWIPPPNIPLPAIPVARRGPEVERALWEVNSTCKTSHIECEVDSPILKPDRQRAAAPLNINGRHLSNRTHGHLVKLPPPNGPLPPVPHRRKLSADSVSFIGLPQDWLLQKSFMENPRPAPVPPPRSPPTASRPTRLSQRDTNYGQESEGRDRSTTIQHTSPTSGLVSIEHPGPRPPQRSGLLFSEVSLDAAMSQLNFRASPRTSTSTDLSRSTASSGASQVSPIARSSTAPASFNRISSISSLRSAPNRVKSALVTATSPRVSALRTAHEKRHSPRKSIVPGSKIDKPSTGSQESSIATLRSALADLEKVRKSPSPGRRTASPKPANFVAEALRPESPFERRRRKGETMSMLLEAGFFPVEELIYGTSKPRRPNSMAKYRINFPPRLSMIGKRPPDTPRTIVPKTPSEQLGGESTHALIEKEPEGVKGKPLPQPASSESNQDLTCEDEDEEFHEAGPPVAESLAVIAEDETSAPESGMTTPKATQIHLPGGSVITVTPPELTAWQPPSYIHGPIKLPKPAILPGKDTLASLEPFQDAVEHVYQHALTIPRLVSDDAMIDDLCDFVEEFGIDDVSLQVDLLLSAGDHSTDSIGMLACSHGDEGGQSCIAIAPNGIPSASPVEKVVAEEVMHTRALMPESANVIPPAETEEALRAKGIARLRGSVSKDRMACREQRKESATLPSVALLPAPEVTMWRMGMPRASAWEAQASPKLEYAASRENGVEEMDAGSTWMASALVPKQPGWSKGLSARNPMARMRQLVATASTIL